MFARTAERASQLLPRNKTLTRHCQFIYLKRSAAKIWSLIFHLTFGDVTSHILVIENVDGLKYAMPREI